MQMVERAGFPFGAGRGRGFGAAGGLWPRDMATVMWTRKGGIADVWLVIPSISCCRTTWSQPGRLDDPDVSGRVSLSRSSLPSRFWNCFSQLRLPSVAVSADCHLALTRREYERAATECASFLCRREYSWCPNRRRADVTLNARSRTRGRFSIHFLIFVFTGECRSECRCGREGGRFPATGFFHSHYSIFNPLGESLLPSLPLYLYYLSPLIPSHRLAYALN